MSQAQEVLLDLLAALRNFEAADEDDAAADEAAISAVFAARESLVVMGYRRGADGCVHRR